MTAELMTTSRPDLTDALDGPARPPWSTLGATAVTLVMLILAWLAATDFWPNSMGAQKPGTRASTSWQAAAQPFRIPDEDSQEVIVIVNSPEGEAEADRLISLEASDQVASGAESYKIWKVRKVDTPEQESQLWRELLTTLAEPSGRRVSILDLR